MRQRQQLTTESDENYLQRALRWCKGAYRRRVAQDAPYCVHRSHYAASAMRATEQRFPDLGTFGTEGFSFPDDSESVTYLNTGCSFQPTITFDSDNLQFAVCSVADLQEEYEHRKLCEENLVSCGYCGKMTECADEWRETTCHNCGKNVATGE